MNLYLLQYNNYYNRLVKREEGISAYLDFVVYGPNSYEDYGLTNVENWYPGDNVNTQQVVNTPAADFDYMLVVDEKGYLDSRWFVVDAVKNSYNQYVLSLHRDLLADYFDFAMSSTCYIERAMVSATNNFIYNSENMAFNQIKKSEVLLTDKSRCPWIIGYIADNAFTTGEEGSTITEDIEIESSLDGKHIDESILNATDSLFTKSFLEGLGSGICGTIGRTTYVVEGLNGAAIYPVDKYGFKFGDETEGYQGPKADQNIKWGGGFLGNRLAQTAQEMTNKFNANANIRANAHTAIKANYALTQTFISNEDFQWLLNNQNRVLKDSEGNYFSITVEQNGVKELSTTIGPNSGNAFTDVMNIIKDYMTNYNEVAANPKHINLYVDYTQLRVNVTAILTRTFKVKIKSNVRKLIDAPYRMFAIPCPLNGEEWAGAAQYMETITDGGSTQSRTNICIPNAEASMNMAMDIARKLGSKLYDLQLLPYCPLTELGYDYFTDTPTSHNKKFLLLDNYLSFNATTGEVITRETDHTVVSPVVIQKEEAAEGANYELATYILWAKKSNFSFTIQNIPKESDALNRPLPATPFVSVPTNAIDFKVEHETGFYRLTSPNYNGTFEFKATSNRGIDYFEVDATYKPYSPYLKIAPNFKGLYGGDYDDARGLILGGDFSLPTLTEAWEQYQINNKSYKDSFEAQITNMENVYDIQRRQAQEAAGYAALSATISGASSGALIGGALSPIGATAGIATGALAGAASIYGAQRDLAYAEELHNESKRYAREQYDYSLQNIRALPYSLNKVSAFDKNNKYFPFLEYYSCTEEEKEALRQKLKYTSMHIGAMGKVLQYKQAEPTFIQAQLVRIDNYIDEETGHLVEFHDDYHLATAIAAELHKGFYL